MKLVFVLSLFYQTAKLTASWNKQNNLYNCSLESRFFHLLLSNNSCAYGIPSEKSACDCLPGFLGPRCNQPECIHGSLASTNSSSYFCKCELGFSGPRCEVPICSAHGRLKKVRQRCKCICDEGWRGKHCAIPICVHGNLVHLSSSDACQCDTDWTGIRCQDPVCYHGESKGHWCFCVGAWNGKHCDKCYETSFRYIKATDECVPRIQSHGKNPDTFTNSVGGGLVFGVLLLCVLLYCYVKHKQKQGELPAASWLIVGISGNSSQFPSGCYQRGYSLVGGRSYHLSNTGTSTDIHATDCNITSPPLPPSYSSVVVADSEPPPSYLTAINMARKLPTDSQIS